jgi:antitoxin VapB
MHLNIKSDRAHAMATELSGLTGETLTGAVTRAIEERLTRVRSERSVEEKVAAVMAIVRAAGGKGSGHSSDHAELLYDERGLPLEW